MEGREASKSYEVSSTVASEISLVALKANIAITAAGATGGTLTLKGKIPGQPEFTAIDGSDSIDFSTGEPLFIQGQPVQSLEITPAAIVGAAGTITVWVTPYNV